LEKIHCSQWPASFENGIALVRRIIWIRLILSPRQPMLNASQPVAAEIGRQSGCECLRNQLGPILQKTELLAGLISLEVKSSIIKSLNLRQVFGRNLANLRRVGRSVGTHERKSLTCG